MGSTDPFKAYQDNFRTLQAKDAEARAAGRIVGRYISEPFADGYAYYVVVQEKRATVIVKVVTGIGDDWTIPYWGTRASIQKSYALDNIKRRDTLDELFRKSNEG